ITVEVTNTGEVAGKDVVQVYARAPFRSGSAEKSATELVGYAKTETLEPGDSQDVSIEFPIRDLASWDSRAGGYVLEEGEYELSVATDVHSPVTTRVVDLDEKVYDTDEVTGAQLPNRFPDLRADLTYLSRQDWQGSYPHSPEGERTASEQLLAEIEPTFTPADRPAPDYRADNSLRLSDLAGVPMD